MSKITSSTEDTVDFLRDRNLLARNWVCCLRVCNEVKCKTSDHKEFKCLECHRRYSIRSNSIFYDVHMRLTHLLLLIYLFATNTSVLLASRYLGTKVSAKSIALWYDQLRNVMSIYLVSHPIKLGSADSVVEIDETCLGRKQKYHRGTIRGSGQKWVLGLIDRQTKLCHLQLVPNRTRDVLLPIIELHVVRDSIIHTDEAPVYRILSQRGYEHYTVCHKETYVAPDGTHTNLIESVWAQVKQVFKEKRGVRNDKMPAHLDEWLYRWNRKNEGPTFELILQDIALQNPV